MAKARIYKAIPKPSASLAPRLIRGISGAEIRDHLVRDTFDVAPATAEDVAAIMGADGDVRLEDAQAEIPLAAGQGAQS